MIHCVTITCRNSDCNASTAAAMRATIKTTADCNKKDSFSDVFTFLSPLDPVSSCFNRSEGLLSPSTERASVSAISLRHIIWLPHESHAGVSLPSAVAGAAIWLRQKNLRHILASPGYAPGTIAVNVKWIEREFNSCQTLARSIIPIYLQTSTISEI